MRPRNLLGLLIAALAIVLIVWQYSLLQQSRQLAALLEQRVSPGVAAALSSLQALPAAAQPADQLAAAEAELLQAAVGLAQEVRLLPGELHQAWQRLLQARIAFSRATNCLQHIEGLTLQYDYQRLSAKYTEYLSQLTGQLLSLQPLLAANRLTAADVDRIADLLAEMQRAADAFFRTLLPIP